MHMMKVEKDMTIQSYLSLGKISQKSIFISLLGGLVFECLSALKVDRLKSDCPSMKRIVELKEEEEEQEDEDDLYDDSNDEVFSLELERGDRGLGLALVDSGVSNKRDVDL